MPMYGGTPMGDYTISEFCLDGHWHGSSSLTGRSGGSVDVEWPAERGVTIPLRTKHCPQCGKGVINRCDACGAYIRNPDVFSGCDEPSLYCWDCGAAYPWTRARRVAFDETIDFLTSRFAGELPEHLADELKAFVPDLQQETPRTNLAILKLQSLARTGGQAGKAALDAAVRAAAGQIVDRLMNKVD